MFFNSPLSPFSSIETANLLGFKAVSKNIIYKIYIRNKLVKNINLRYPIMPADTIP